MAMVWIYVDVQTFFIRCFDGPHVPSRFDDDTRRRIEGAILTVF